MKQQKSFTRMNKKAVITGANGFIGSNLTRLLTKEGYEVLCLVRSGSDFSLLPADANILFWKSTSDKAFITAVKSYEILIHCAALTKAKSRDTFRKANVDLTLEIVKLFNETESLNKFIFLSSQAAAGPALSYSKEKSEDDICNPISMYGKSKLLAEHLVRERVKKSWVIIRPVSVYGKGDKDFLQYFRMIKKHLSVQIGKKDKFINLIYIDDLCELILETIKNPKADKQIFFVSDGIKYSVRDFGKLVEKAIPSFAFPVRIPEKILSSIAFFNELFSRKTLPILNREKVKEIKCEYWLVSNVKTKNVLGFSMKPNISNNLQKTYNWYKEHKWIK
jgi:nucleoside-diphosphate-sugar epimerase